MLGRAVGNFQIVRKLGEGGMGAVYEAVHHAIGRRAAVKVLHPAFAHDPDLVKRFFNEARAANLIEHPAMVAVFDYGLLDDGAAYLVMEYLGGETLAARQLRCGGRLGDDALRFARQIAGALAAAHDVGIVHRDLKPDNVMVVADPEAQGGERVKILDFGIAKLAERHAVTGAGQTRTGAVMGTPLYMAPEQCRGAGNVDARADVYALGAMLFHQLTGRPPFEGDGAGAVLAKHIYEPPPPLGPEIAADVAALVLRALAKEPAERPAMREVERWLAARLSSPGLVAPLAAHTTLGGAAHARAAPSTIHTGARPRRALAAAAVALAAAGVIGWVIARPDPRGPAASRGATAGEVVDAGAAAEVGAPLDAAPPPVRWQIVTLPAGATVEDERGRILGTTPFDRRQDAAAGEATLVVRLDGHQPLTVVVDRGRDELRTLVLARAGRDARARRSSRPADPVAELLAPPAPAAPTPPSARPTAPSADDFDAKLRQQRQRSTGPAVRVEPVE